MLGLSDPRFAWRVRFQQKGGGYFGLVNVRRLRRILPQLNSVRAIREPRRLSSIADSYLSIPKIYQTNSWHVLGLPSQILRHLGEHDAPPQDVPVLVPYLRQLDVIGGGLCAQACCFMATMFTYHIVTSVVSLPEITILARPSATRTPYEDFPLGGLTATEVCHYFRAPRIGMWAETQYFNYNRVRYKERESHFSAAGGITTLARNRIGRALRGYIRSGFPILLRVDSDRMRGKTSGRCNIQPVSLYFAGDRPNAGRSDRSCRHMVVVFGYHETDDKYLVQDPAHRPFVEMSTDAILRNSTYTAPEVAKEAEIEFGSSLDYPLFIPVTPDRVKTALLSLKPSVERSRELPEDESDSAFQPGLVEIAGSFDWSIFWGRSLSALPPNDHRDFLLVKIAGEYSNLDFFEHNPLLQRCGLTPTDLSNFFDFLKTEGWALGQWLWLEIGVGMCGAWNAELDLSSLRIGDSIETLIVGMGYISNGQWSWKAAHCVFDSQTAMPPGPPTIQQVASPQSNPHASTSCSVGVITSFTERGLCSNEIKKLSNGHCNHIELYAFMRDEVEMLCPSQTTPLAMIRSLPKQCSSLTAFVKSVFNQFPIRFDRNRPKKIFYKKPILEPYVPPIITAEDWLAENCKNLSALERLANRILESSSQGPTLAAICTFFPGIGSLDLARRQRSCSALRAVVKIANLININRPKSIQVIETVTGTLLYGHRVASLPKSRREISGGGNVFWDDDGSAFSARLASKETALSALKLSLEEVVPELAQGLTLSIELEPGDIYVVSELADIKSLLPQLTEYSRIGRSVGLNCDTGHWALAGITSASLNIHGNGAEGGSIIDHIVHVHVSDLGKGHFADLAIGEGVTASTTASIIRSLRTQGCRSTEARPLLFSVEIELAERFDTVEKSMAWTDQQLA